MPDINEHLYRTPMVQLVNPQDDFGTIVYHADDEFNERDPLTGAYLNPGLWACCAFILDCMSERMNTIYAQDLGEL